MNKLIIGVIVSLVIGTGIGYALGNSSSDVGMSKKDADASIVMMKEQAATIQKMATMMRDAGVSLETWSTKYNDQSMVMMGKDMQTVSLKYMKATSTTGTMNKMMGN